MDHITSVEWQKGPKRLTMRRHGLTVRPRIRHDYHELIKAAIAEFQAEATLQSLDVSQPGLRLDRYGHASEGHDPVPGAAITRDRKRYFRAPHCFWGQAREKAMQEGELARIANRVAVWKGSHGEFEAHRHAGSAELLDREIAQLTALNSPDLGVRHADGRSRSELAQSARHPRGAKFAAHAQPDSASVSSRLVDPTLTAGHPDILYRGASPPVISASGALSSTWARGATQISRSADRAAW